MNDLVCNVIVIGVGGVVGGGLSMLWGVDSCILVLGMFVVVMMIRFWLFIGVLLVGFFVMGIIILLLKKLVDLNVEVI